MACLIIPKLSSLISGKRKVIMELKSVKWLRRDCYLWWVMRNWVQKKTRVSKMSRDYRWYSYYRYQCPPEQVRTNVTAPTPQKKELNKNIQSFRGPLFQNERSLFYSVSFMSQANWWLLHYSSHNLVMIY